MYGDLGSRRGRAALTAGLLWAALVGITAAPALAAPDFEARGSVEQVYVTNADPGERLSLLRNGKTLQTKRVNAQGGLLYRKVNPGRGYRVKPDGGGEASPPLRVLSTKSAPPDDSVYDQELPADGYGYLETR